MSQFDSATRPFGALLTHGQLERLFFQLLRKLRPDIFCDIGCHDGRAALLAREALPNSNVLAFESNPEIFELHHVRLAAAGIDHHHLAVNDRSGEVSVFAPRTLSKMWSEGGLIDAAITEPNDTGKTSLLRRNEDATYAEFKVPAQSLDEIFPARDRTFALWIDVEGAAAAVLAGAQKTLESTSAIFIEVENFPFWKNQSRTEDIAEILRARGFVPVAQDREYGDDQFNILFVKESARAAIADLLPPAVYPQSEIAVLIPSFNNPTHLQNIITQLRQVGLRNLTVVDNGSTFPPLLDYLDSLRANLTIIRQTADKGPRDLVIDPAFYDSLPPHFCITDPDLELNPSLPVNFVEHLLGLTSRHRIGKAGFALDISEPARMIDTPFEIGAGRYRIWEWEAQFWERPLPGDNADIAYQSLLDTTFAIYNKAFFDSATHLEAIRVAGRFTARHLPWYREHSLPPDEAAFYRATSQHSFYAGTSPDSKSEPAPLD